MKKGLTQICLGSSSSIRDGDSGAGFGWVMHHSRAVSSSSSSVAMAEDGSRCHTVGPNRSSSTARIAVPRPRNRSMACYAASKRRLSPLCMGNESKERTLKGIACGQASAK